MRKTNGFSALHAVALGKSNMPFIFMEMKYTLRCCAACFFFLSPMESSKKKEKKEGVNGSALIVSRFAIHVYRAQSWRNLEEEFVRSNFTSVEIDAGVIKIFLFYGARLH